MQDQNMQWKAICQVSGRCVVLTSRRGIAKHLKFKHELETGHKTLVRGVKA